MNLLQSFKGLVGRALTRTVHSLAHAVAEALLRVQQGLDWLDGQHPLAIRLKPLAALLARHPRKISATLGGGLLAVAGGAFAVASLGPDASDLPVTNYTESITVPSLSSQAEALDLHDMKLLRSDTTRASDSPESLLRRLGVIDPQAARFMRTNPLVRDALGRAGRSVSAETTD